MNKSTKKIYEYLATGAFLKRGSSNLVRRKGPRWFVANCSSWPSLVLMKRKSGIIEAVHLLIQIGRYVISAITSHTF